MHNIFIKWDRYRGREKRTESRAAENSISFMALFAILVSRLTKGVYFTSTLCVAESKHTQLFFFLCSFSICSLIRFLHFYFHFSHDLSVADYVNFVFALLLCVRAFFPFIFFGFCFSSIININYIWFAEGKKNTRAPSCSALGGKHKYVFLSKKQ